MNKPVYILVCLAAIALVLFFYKISHKPNEDAEPVLQTIPAAAIESPFVYHFDSEATLYESPDPDHSTSPYWWLDSGGLFVMSGGLGHTAAGDLPTNNEWRTRYAESNPVDTDAGAHPQNIFRLITRSVWHNVSEEAYFHIDDYHVSESPNRNESNGILLLSRYQDSDNLYYAGLRVDGYAVIKKKLGGTYYTLGESRVFNGTYNRESEPNLLPASEWIGLRSVVTTEAPNLVRIELYMDRGQSGEWKKVFEAVDRGLEAPIIDKTSRAGLRTDFMDVSFEDFKIEEL
ncbi:hypothetical protein KW785_02595 [Candidatus Parcubacteria bacterium]|nr:hypothetical protein [Candidatus Parcubacteria bacterium]